MVTGIYMRIYRSLVHIPDNLASVVIWLDYYYCTNKFSCNIIFTHTSYISVKCNRGCFFWYDSQAKKVTDSNTPIYFCRGYCITVGIGLLCGEIVYCIVSYLIQVQKKSNPNPNRNHIPNPNPNPNPDLTLTLTVYCLLSCIGMKIICKNISPVGLKKSTIKATLYAGCFNCWFYTNTLYVLGYMWEYIIVDLVGSVGSVDSNRLSIVVRFILWCYIQVPYIEKRLYLTWYSPICLLSSHSMVYSKNNS